MTESEKLIEECTTPFPYKPGDVVQLKSGGNPMTVKGYDTVGNVICVWLNGTELAMLYADIGAVEPASATKPEPCADRAQLRVELYALLEMLAHKHEFDADFFQLSSTAPKDQPKLKPCPFCGSEPISPTTRSLYVWCRCGANTRSEILGEAVKTWNRRSSKEPTQKCSTCGTIAPSEFYNAKMKTCNLCTGLGV